MVRNSSFTLRAVKGFQAGRGTSSDCLSRRVALQHGEWTGRQRDKQGGGSGDGCSRPGRDGDSPDAGGVVRMERPGRS